MDRKKKKTALIVEGGGQRGVFSFGVIDTFIEYNFDPFDFFIGVSNGASVLFWYLIRDQLNNLEKMLFSANKRYFNYANILTGKDILNFYELFQDAYGHFKPNLNALEKNLADRLFLSVVTSAETGKANYIHYSRENIINILVATGTLPILVRRPSIIAGERVFDGGIADPLPVKQAYRMGAKRIILIRTFPKGKVRSNKVENLIASFFVRRYPKLSRMIRNHASKYNESLNFINNPPKDLEIFQVQPDAKLVTERNTLDHQILEQDYQLGKQKGYEFLEL